MRLIFALFAALILVAGMAAAQPAGSQVNVSVQASDALTGVPVESAVSFAGHGAENVRNSGAGWYIIPEGDFNAVASVPGYFDRAFAISLAGQDTAVYQVRMLKKGAMTPVEVSWTAPNKARIKKVKIEDLARVLLENPKVRVKVIAYLDREGGRKMNQKLADERADAIRAALVRADIDAARVDPEGKLVAVSGKTKALKEANNRVEATFIE